MRPCLHTPAAIGERQQEFVLRWCELNVTPVHSDAMCRPVDAQRTNGEDVARSVPAGTHATQDRRDAEHEFLWAERLREIVVRAKRQALNTILLLAARREHEHRDVLRRLDAAQLFEHFVTGNAR